MDKCLCERHNSVVSLRAYYRCPFRLVVGPIYRPESRTEKGPEKASSSIFGLTVISVILPRVPASLKCWRGFLVSRIVIVPRSNLVRRGGAEPYYLPSEASDSTRSIVTSLAANHATAQPHVCSYRRASTCRRSSRSSVIPPCRLRTDTSTTSAGLPTQQQSPSSTA